jgi:hypothetical protein
MALSIKSLRLALRPIATDPEVDKTCLYFRGVIGTVGTTEVRSAIRSYLSENSNTLFGPQAILAHNYEHFNEILTLGWIEAQDLVLTDVTIEASQIIKEGTSLSPLNVIRRVYTAKLAERFEFHVTPAHFDNIVEIPTPFTGVDARVTVLLNRETGQLTLTVGDQSQQVQGPSGWESGLTCHATASIEGYIELQRVVPPVVETPATE